MTKEDMKSKEMKSKVSGIVSQNESASNAYKLKTVSDLIKSERNSPRVSTMKQS